LPCDRALPYKQIKDFAWALLRLPVDMRAYIRSLLICHAEFYEAEYEDGVQAFLIKPETFERHRKQRVLQ